MKLFIAEKSSLAEKIATHINGNVAPSKEQKKFGYYDLGDSKVAYMNGHMLEMLSPGEYKEEWGKWSLDSLPIIIDKFEFRISDSKKKLYSAIKPLFKQADEIINAGDPDREGQYLVDLLIDYVGVNKPVSRLWPDDLTPKGMERAFSMIKPNSEYKSLSDSARCRSISDFLLGINLTRAYTILAKQNGYPNVVSIGRVQTVLWSIIYRRCKQIENFEPQPYYQVTAKAGFNGSMIDVNWIRFTKDENDDSKCFDISEAEKVVSDCNGNKFLIRNVKRDRVKKAAPLPFTLDQLQAKANSAYGYGAADVLAAAQYLYEHLTVINYPRTECSYLYEGDYQNADETIDHILRNEQLEMKHVPKADLTNNMPACFNDKKKGAHAGLMPTTKPLDIDALLATPDKDLRDAKVTLGQQDLVNIYKLICMQYLAQFMPPYMYDSTIIDLSCSTHSFKSESQVLVQSGWRDLLGGDSKKKTVEIPVDLSSGDSADIHDMQVVTKKTKPPAYFNEGTIIEMMANIQQEVDDPRVAKLLSETSGLGTNATRSDMIQKNYLRSMIKKDGKRVVYTEVAEALYPHLGNYLQSPNLTAFWEQLLAKVSDGDVSMDKYLGQLIPWVEKSVKDVIETRPKIVLPVDSKHSCPECQQPVLRSKKKPDVWYCTNTDNRHFFSNKRGNPDFTEYKNGGHDCIHCESKLKRIAKGKYGPFWVCKGDKPHYYKEQNNSPVILPGELSKCEKCESGIMRVKAGGKFKPFLGCSNYPECKHTISSDKK